MEMRILNGKSFIVYRVVGEEIPALKIPKSWDEHQKFNTVDMWVRNNKLTPTRKEITVVGEWLPEDDKLYYLGAVLLAADCLRNNL